MLLKCLNFNLRILSCINSCWSHIKYLEVFLHLWSIVMLIHMRKGPQPEEHPVQRIPAFFHFFLSFCFQRQNKWKFWKIRYSENNFVVLRDITKATLLVQTYEFLEVLNIHGYTFRRAPCSLFTAVFITYLLFVVVVHPGIISSLPCILPILSARHFQYR